MMRYCFFLLAICLSFSGFTQTLENSMLLDLGPNNVTDGNPTESPDVNGNYWNNMTNPVATSINVALNSKSNESTGITVSIANGLNKNGINHGGLLSPGNELGDYAINTATQDYFFTNADGAIVFKNLKADRGYSFKLFASRVNEEVRVSQYEIVGANSQILQLQSSGLGIGEGGYDGNTSMIVESELIYPDESLEILLELTKVEGQFAYINFLELNEFSDVNFSAVESISIVTENLEINSGFVQLQADISPADATFQGIDWSVDNRDLAYISNDAKLYGYKNGEVMVTARSKEPNSNITATKAIKIENQSTKRMMIDLGSDNSIDGNITTITNSGDQWSNHTNNATGSEPSPTNFVDGSISTITITTVSNMGVSGILDGGLLDPTDNLGELGIGSATQDYFSSQNSGQLVFGNLDLNNGYRFDCFGSRAAADERATRYTLTGLNTSTGTLQTSGKDLGGTDVNSNTNKFYTSDVIFPDSNGEITLSLSISQGQFAYLNALRITEYQDVDICPSIDENLIAVMGSSVARGQGAPSDMGYAYMYNQLLSERGEMSGSREFKINNISVGGNNTIKVLDRWDTDLLPLCGNYVIYGLSLGNEGIANNGQVAFDQFRNNMQILITQAKDRGITPVIMNNYPREDFGPVQYQFIKDMNLLIHEWDVPSFNSLGAIDDGTGKWVQAYQQDFGHPNQEGHREFFLNMVPSLFDALDAGKPLPSLQVSEGYSFLKEEEIFLSFEPDHLMHSFTVVFDFKTSDSGEIGHIENENSLLGLNIDPEGNIRYISSNGELVGDEPINDDEWHQVAITHYYAMGKTFIYVDGEKMEGEIVENLEPTLFEFQSNHDDDLNITMRNMHIYRGGMNSDELAALYDGVLLKSSLEVYAPLSNVFLSENFAQSTELLNLEGITSISEIEGGDLRLFPNPAKETIEVFASNMIIDSIHIRNIQNKLIKTGFTKVIDVKDLQPGVYYLHIVSGTNSLTKKFVKI